MAGNSWWRTPTHPLWLVGFRPFFTLAFIAGALLPLIWAVVFTGMITIPTKTLGPVGWHAHEMLYGFGWAVLGGFLLTASKNWVKIRGLHGLPLMLMALIWVVERAAVLMLPIETPEVLRFILLNAFLLSVIGYVVWSLVRYRSQDTFRDNLIFIVALPLFLLAKNLLLEGTTYSMGVSMSVGLFRVAFAIMFERTMTQFMKNAHGVELVRNPLLDWPAKVLILIAAVEPILPRPVAIAALLGAALFLGLRWFLWKPLEGFKTFGIAIMYVGYMGLVLHLLAEAANISGVFAGIGALSIHIFTFLTMGMVIPGMMIRISQGHTGRKFLFTASDRLAFGAMAGAAVFRLVATQVWPEHYMVWIAIAGVGWSICFALIGWRLTPFLWQARVDGKEH